LPGWRIIGWLKHVEGQMADLHTDAEMVSRTASYHDSATLFSLAAFQQVLTTC